MFAITAGTIHHHSFIGGQHGEEEKGKGSGKEGREEGQAPEEEVGETLLTVSTSDEVELPDMGRRESRSGERSRDCIRPRRPGPRMRASARGSSLPGLRSAEDFGVAKRPD